MKRLSETASKIELGVPDSKKCSKCNVLKSLNLFSKDSSRKDKKSVRCKICDQTYFQLRSQETRKKAKERQASGRYDLYYQEYRLSNKEAKKASNKLWKELNRSLKRFYDSKREARKLKATPQWLSKVHLEQIKLIYAHARDCQITTGEEYHVDHIVPLQGKIVCGLHVPWNLQVLPAEVNIRKNNRYENT